MFRPFFIHRQYSAFLKPKFKGFTAYVEQDPDNSRMLRVRVTFCSRKDSFCKATGRKEVLNKTTWTVINKRDLPSWVSQCTAVCLNESSGADWFVQDELFLLKYVV